MRVAATLLVIGSALCAVACGASHDKTSLGLMVGGIFSIVAGALTAIWVS